MAETIESTALRLEKIKKKIEGYIKQPWSIYHAPFHVAGDVYYLGNRYVSSFLIDTGEGLILIDPGFLETSYQLFDAVRRLGFDTREIKHIFLSHGHVDHVGGTRLLQEYTKAKVWIGEGDVFFFTERRDLIQDEDHVPEFHIDGTYRYEQPFTMGRIKIRFIHTPGHTPGTTSFLIETVHRGKPITCGMHGGLGLNGLTEQELREHGLPLRLQRDFIDGLISLKQLSVDVVLASHMHNYDMLARKAADDGSGDAFLDPEGWQNMLNAQLQKAREILPHLFKEEENYL